jgi:hypothetical protein
LLPLTFRFQLSSWQAHLSSEESRTQLSVRHIARQRSYACSAARVGQTF